MNARLPSTLIFALLITLVSGWAKAQPVPQGIVVTPPSDLIQVDIQTDEPAYAVGDTVQIQYEVSANAFIYIFGIDPSGNVIQIFPNEFSQNNFVPAGQHTLPDTNTYSLVVTLPTGTELLQIFASLEPIDFGVEGFLQSFPQLGDAGRQCGNGLHQL